MNKRENRVFAVVPNDNIIVYLVRLGSILFFAFILTTALNYVGVTVVAIVLLLINAILKTEYNYFYNNYFEQYEYGIVPFFNKKLRVDFETVKSITFFEGFVNPLKFAIPGEYTAGIDAKDVFIITFNDNSKKKIIIRGNNKQMKNVVLFFKSMVKEFSVE